MKAFLRKYGDAIQIVLGLAVAASAVSGMLGKPARLVQLVALTAGVFSVGLGAGQAVAGRRARREARREQDH